MQPPAGQDHAVGCPPDPSVKRLPSAVEQWQPPVEAELLARIATLLREVIPLEQILDDIGDVLGNQDPRMAEFTDIAARLRADVGQLVTIANSDRRARDDVPTRLLVERARALSAETLPTLSPQTLDADCRRAVGYLRRLATAANGLLEHLAEIRTVKKVA